MIESLAELHEASTGMSNELINLAAAKAVAESRIDTPQALADFIVQSRGLITGLVNELRATREAVINSGSVEGLIAVHMRMLRAESAIDRVKAQAVQFDIEGSHIAANRIRAALEWEE